METKTVICTICPVGCGISIKYSGEKIEEMIGTQCKRGEVYAADEALNPRRTLTTTIPIENARIKYIPVKTNKPIPKSALFEAMRLANGIKAVGPVKMGDVAMADFIEPGVDLIACRDSD